jgi:hypothetical protein
VFSQNKSCSCVVAKMSELDSINLALALTKGFNLPLPMTFYHFWLTTYLAIIVVLSCTISFSTENAKLINFIMLAKFAPGLLSPLLAPLLNAALFTNRTE